MTHSLHRRGTNENLKGDIVFIFCPAKHLNEIGSGEKTKQFYNIIRKHNPKNFGDDLTGNIALLGPEQLYKNIRDMTNIHVSFNSVEDASGALKELAEADLGISVVVSGLFEELKGCCNHAHVPFHTIEHSLGFWGNTKELPSEETLEVITMCGHGLVAAPLVHSLVEKISKNKMTAKAAAAKLAGLCLCGIFNPDRAEVLLQQMADCYKKDVS